MYILYVYVISHTDIVNHMEDISRSDNDVIDQSIIDSIWNIVPDEIKQSYVGIQYRDTTPYLVPIDDNTTCPVCCRCHDRTRPHINAYEGSYYITCWQWIRSPSDEGYGPIHIGHYNHISMSSDTINRMASRAINRFKSLSIGTHTVHQQDLQYTYTGGDLYVKSAMGTGKTKMLQSIIDSSKSYIIISNRIIQANKYSNMFPKATLYGTDGWTDVCVDKLVVQLESIHKIERHQYQYVVLDEIEGILRLLISSTMYNKEMDTIGKLIDIISRCDMCITMDAFLKESTIGWIKTLRYGRQYNIVVNTYRQIERSGMKNVYCIPNRKQWVSKLVDDNSRKVIACLSKNMANRISTMLYDKGESTCLVITGDSDNSIKTADPHTLWCRYHNIIYTSAIANSISYEYNHFNTLYVYGCRGSAGPEELLQMMGRVRSMSSNDIYVHCSRVWFNSKNDDEDTSYEQSIILDEYLPMSDSAVMKDMKTIGSSSRLSIRKHILSRIWNILDDRIRILYSRLYADRGCGQRYLYDPV